MRQLKEAISGISNISASCSGMLPEFDTVIVTASRDPVNDHWNLAYP